MMRIRKEIREADRILSDSANSIPFSIINPVNEPAVRKNFFANKIKNPVLEYEPPKSSLLEMRRRVSSINIDEIDVLDSIINEKQMIMIRKIDMLNSVGCFDFTEKSIKVYGLPDRKLINKAYEIAGKKIRKKKAEKILSKDAVGMIKKNLKKFGLEYYKVKKADIVSSCVVNYEKRMIKLKKKSRFSKDFINRLIVHEIGTHVFRHENGKLQRLKILARGLNYYEVEEGLAAYNEERFNVLKESFMKNYAGRVIAVATAQRADFYSTFKELNRFFDKKISFQLALRAKRGLTDTSLEGGFTKDYLYLSGYYKIKEFVNKGGRINDLYYGKIDVEDIEPLKTIGLIKPKFIPKSFILFEEQKE